MREDWPCGINLNLLVGDNTGDVDAVNCRIVGSPSEGQGDRCLYCDQYERCLDFAILSEWSGFNCCRCTYANQGPVIVMDSYFAGIVNDAALRNDEECLVINDGDWGLFFDFDQLDIEQSLPRPPDDLQLDCGW